MSLNVWRLHRMSLLPRAIWNDDKHMSGNATSVGILPWSIKRVIIILGLKGHLEIEYLLCWGYYNNMYYNDY